MNYAAAQQRSQLITIEIGKQQSFLFRQWSEFNIMLAQFVCSVKAENNFTVWEWWVLPADSFVKILSRESELLRDDIIIFFLFFFLFFFL